MKKILILSGLLATCGTLCADSTYTFLVQPGMKAQNGWIRITDDYHN